MGRAGHCWLRRFLPILLALGLGGCVGLVRTRLDWMPVTGDVRSKAEVLARYGEPLRRERQDDREVWYYALSGAQLGGRRPATEGSTVLYLVVTPVWWRTHPAANARFGFDGERVVEVAVLTASEHGFFCGLNIAAEHLALCGPVP